jgi:hypothetical protein
MTSVALSLRATRMARHLWVNPSTTFSIRILHPSWVRSSTKSYDQTWFGRSGLSRTQDPLLSQSRPIPVKKAGHFGRMAGVSHGDPLR